MSNQFFRTLDELIEEREMTSLEEMKAIQEQILLNVGKVGRSIKCPDYMFFITEYTIWDTVVIYEVIDLRTGGGGWHSHDDTEILPDVQAYKNLSTGEFYVSNHKTEQVNFVDGKSTIRISSPLDDYPCYEIAVENPTFIDVIDSEVYGYKVKADRARSVAMMLLHAADMLEGERPHSKASTQEKVRHDS